MLNQPPAIAPMMKIPIMTVKIIAQLSKYMAAEVMRSSACEETSRAAHGVKPPRKAAGANQNGRETI